jgi:DNA-binding Lrp family transcriptional regulator
MIRLFDRRLNANPLHVTAGSPPRMDEIDRAIVALLRENARRSYQDVGRHVHLSAPAVKRRVDRLERDGVILGYTAIIDPHAFGWHAEAFVDLYCAGKMPAADIKRAVQDKPGVVSAHTVAGEASAVLHVMAEDTKDLEQVLERIRATDGVTRTVTEVVLSTLFQR